MGHQGSQLVKSQYEHGQEIEPGQPRPLSRPRHGDDQIQRSTQKTEKFHDQVGRAELSLRASATMLKIQSS